MMKVFRNNWQAFTSLILAVAIAIAVPIIGDRFHGEPTAPAFSDNYTAKAEKKLPIYSVDVPDMRMSISFDAAWGADDTDTLMEILKDNGVLATFFLCGTWVDKYPEEVKKIAAAGHDIANHGNKHAHGAKLDLAGNKKEIQDCHDKIKAVTGIDANLFRPPYGEYNNTVLTAAEELGYYTIQWDVDSHDWMKKGIDYEINQVLNHKNLQNGSIVLFHNDAKFTPQTLDPIIKGLKEKGYTLVPISQLIHKDNFQIDHTGRQKLKASAAE